MDKQLKREVKKELFAFNVFHVLPEFCNSKQLQHRPGADDTWRISYDDHGRRILLEEVISRDSGKHILELTSISVELNEKRESAIHHHPQKGHPGYHLQFMIRLSGTRKIRIFLENLDKEGYLRCVRGFLSVAKDIIENECKRDKLPSLTRYFFNDTIDDLESDKLYLRKQVLLSQVLGDDNKPLGKPELEDLKQDAHVLPFFQ
ncbi:MAG: hypothetical protein V1735_00010 [Nanoarchaeota archaeon]